MTHNIQPVYVASHFPPHSLSETPISKLTRDELLALLSNERNLRSLKAAALGDSSRLGTIARLCALVIHRREAVCLLDFDVLRSYLSLDRDHVKYSTPDALSIEVFFEHGKINYAFPLGAFEELLEYLQQKRISSEGRTDRGHNIIQKEALAEVLSVLQSDDVAATNNQKTLEDLRSFESDSQGADPEIVRLLAVLKGRTVLLSE